MDGEGRKVLYVGLVVDRSTSIRDYGLVDAMVASVNEYVEGLRGADADIRLSLTLFDTSLTEVCVGYPLDRVPQLAVLAGEGQVAYFTRGSTALYDAIAATAEALDREHGQDENAKFLIVTLTDGEENSSRRHSAGSLASMVSEFESRGNWSFAYIGFGQDKRVVQGVHGLGYVGDSGYYAGATAADVRATTRSASMATVAFAASAAPSTGNLMADAGVTDVAGVADSAPTVPPPVVPVATTGSRADVRSEAEKSLSDWLGSPQ